jgi:hypothetical protein
MYIHENYEYKEKNDAQILRLKVNIHLCASLNLKICIAEVKLGG